MIELEDVFSENDKYLIREYEKHGTDDFLLVDLGEKSYVVPYKYTIGSDSGKMAQQRFLTALLDFEDFEIGKYHRAGQPVMSLEYEGREYIVPFGKKGRFFPKDLADEFYHKADTKYNSIINAARMLEEKGKPVEKIDFSSFSANKYAKALSDMNATMLLDEHTPEKLNILDFLHSVADKPLQNFHTSVKKITRSIKKEIIEAEHNASKNFVPKYYKVSALAALIGLSATAGFLSENQKPSDTKETNTQQTVNVVPDDKKLFADFDADKNSLKPLAQADVSSSVQSNQSDGARQTAQTENKTQHQQSREAKQSSKPIEKVQGQQKQSESVKQLSQTEKVPRPQTKQSEKKVQKSLDYPGVKHKKAPNSKDYFINFMGKKYSDTYGNIHLVQDFKPEISALLLSVEGFAPKAFLDGNGTPTIGVGSTFYLDERGREVDVRLGDRISMWRGMLYKWRYIDKYMLPYLGDNFGRACSPREALAGIGAGFCWGPSAFASSGFLESMKNNESLSQQLRKLSGFRKQKGLLKRSYVLACCLSGAWTPKDLLDLPVYEIKGKGFVHCSIYTLDLHEIMPCRKDTKGNYLKDEEGNDIPKVARDGYCFSFHMDRAMQLRKKLINEAKKGNRKYKTVRELLPADMVKSIENTNYVSGNSLQNNRNMALAMASNKEASR